MLPGENLTLLMDDSKTMSVYKSGPNCQLENASLMNDVLQVQYMFADTLISSSK